MYDAAPYERPMWILPCKNGKRRGSDCERVGEDGIVGKNAGHTMSIRVRWTLKGSGREKKHVGQVVGLEASGLSPDDLDLSSPLLLWRKFVLKLVHNGYGSLLEVC